MTHAAIGIDKEQPRRAGHPTGRLRLFRIAAAHRRTGRNDLMLGAILAFVAGAMNAGGFLAIGHYTSHMTGIVSSIADNLALGLFGLVGSGIALLVSFTLGAACSAILINWARRHARRQQYAYPLALESEDVSVIDALFDATGVPGPRFAHLRTRPGASPNLPRPSVTPEQVSARLAAHIAK